MYAVLEDSGMETFQYFAQLTDTGVKIMDAVTTPARNDTDPQGWIGVPQLDPQTGLYIFSAISQILMVAEAAKKRGAEAFAGPIFMRRVVRIQLVD